MKHEVEMRQLVHRHLCAMTEEAKTTLAACAATPSGAGLVALYEAARQVAWSIGCSLASNGLPAQPMLGNMAHELEAELLEGYARPGEGHML